MLRIGVISPIGIPHFTSHDVSVEVEGRCVCIPAGTTLHSSNTLMHRWRDWSERGQDALLEHADMEVHLEYWLDAESNKFKMNRKLTLFGVGGRDCPGQRVAMSAMYALMALMMCRYRFVAQNADPDSIQPVQDVRKAGVVYTIDDPIGIVIEKR